MMYGAVPHTEKGPAPSLQALMPRPLGRHEKKFMNAAEFSVTIKVTMDSRTVPTGAEMRAIGAQIAEAAMDLRSDYVALVDVADLQGGEIIVNTGQRSAE